MASPAVLHLIVVAGGAGLRAGAGEPKQFRELAGRTLLAWSLEPFLASPRLASITIAVPPDRVAATAADLDARLGARGRVCAGGDTRTASTWCAVETLSAAHAPARTDLVAVHDAARPFVSADLVERLAAAAETEGGAVPGVPVADTIVACAKDDDVAYLDRAILRAVQTPQVFRWETFHAAHARAAAEGLTFTDDGGLLADYGTPPVLVEGETANWKVTTSADFARARALLEDRR